MLHIGSVEEHKGYRTTYRLKGFKEIQTNPMMSFTIYPMNLSEQDAHDLRLDPSFIPSPRFIHPRSFDLPLYLSIV